MPRPVYKQTRKIGGGLMMLLDSKALDQDEVQEFADDENLKRLWTASAKLIIDNFHDATELLVIAANN